MYKAWHSEKQFFIFMNIPVLNFFSFCRSFEKLKWYEGNSKAHIHLTSLNFMRVPMRDVDHSLPSVLVEETKKKLLTIKTNLPSDNEHLVAFLMKGLPSLTLRTGCGFYITTYMETVCFQVRARSEERANNALGPLREWLETTVKTGIEKHSCSRKVIIPFDRHIPIVILIQALTARGHHNIKAIQDRTNTRIVFSARGVKPHNIKVYAHSEEEVIDATKLVHALVKQTFKQMQTYHVGKLPIPEDLPEDFDIYSTLEQLHIALDKAFQENRPIVTLCWEEENISNENAYACFDIRAESLDLVEDAKDLLLRKISHEVEQFKRQSHDIVVYPSKEKYKKFSKVMNTSGHYLLTNFIASDDSLRNIRLHYKGDKERKREKNPSQFLNRPMKIQIRGDNPEDVQRVVNKVKELIQNYTDVFIH